MGADDNGSKRQGGRLKANGCRKRILSLVHRLLLMRRCTRAELGRFFSLTFAPVR